jgi:hypothetical protein
VTAAAAAAPAPAPAPAAPPQSHVAHLRALRSGGAAGPEVLRHLAVAETMASLGRHTRAAGERNVQAIEADAAALPATVTDDERRDWVLRRAAQLTVDSSRQSLAFMAATAAALTAVQRQWVISGEPSEHLDYEVALLVNRGLQVECVQPGKRYRFAGPLEVCDALVTPEDKREGAQMLIEYEVPPVAHTDISSTVAPVRPYRRTITVHGAQASALSSVVRAIDRGLAVAPAGNLRFAVTGRTADLMAWLAAAVHDKPLAEVMALHRITPEMVAEEDGIVSTGPLTVNVATMPEPGPLTVHVASLPERRTRQEVTRDSQGEVVSVTSIEGDAP